MAIDWFHEFEGVSRPLRLGMEAQGCLALVSCIDQLQPLLSSFPDDTAQQLIGVLDVALLAQERKDYLLVADMLEHEIAPLLRRAGC